METTWNIAFDKSSWNHNHCFLVIDGFALLIGRQRNPKELTILID